MPSYSKAILVGHMARDPEWKDVGSNGLCAFSVAVGRKWTAKDGTKKEAVSFIDCKAWGKVGEFVNKWFAKGKPILVEGELEQETWEAQDGGKRSKLVVNVSNATFVGDGGGSGKKAPVGDDIPF